MKKKLLIITVCMGIAACSSNSTSDSNADTSARQGVVAQNSNATIGTKVTSASKGETLMASADCNTCHKADIKLVGPSYKDIAGKYTNADVVKLTEKVIKGGSGVWGDAAMTPHPALSKDDAEEMVKYILSTK